MSPVRHMKSPLLALIAVLGSTLLQPATAATVACPDLAAAVQVNACPAEEELKYTFTGYCSDNAKAYKNETGVCTDYQSYRALKNTARWESADGEFSAYVSCDLPAAALKGLKASAARVLKKGKQTQLVCSYGKDIRFTFRTRGECKLAAGNCAANAAACRAECE